MMMNSQFWGHPIGRCCKSCGWRSQSLAFFGRNFAVPVQSISTSNCNWSAIMHFHHSGSWQMDGNSYFWHKYIEYLPIIVLLCLVVCRCCIGGWCKSLGTRWQNFVIKQANHLSDLMSGISLDNSDVLVSFLKTSFCCFVMFCRFLRGLLPVPVCKQTICQAIDKANMKSLCLALQTQCLDVCRDGSIGSLSCFRHLRWRYYVVQSGGHSRSF